MSKTDIFSRKSARFPISKLVSERTLCSVWSCPYITTISMGLLERCQFGVSFTDCFDTASLFMLFAGITTLTAVQDKFLNLYLQTWDLHLLFGMIPAPTRPIEIYNNKQNTTSIPSWAPEFFPGLISLSLSAITGQNTTVTYTCSSFFYRCSQW